MGKTKKSGLGVGIGSSPQMSITQAEYDNKISELEKRNEMIQPLIDAGVKFNKDDVIFVTKDKSGQMVWLEKGNDRAGLSHILNKHLDDYINKNNILKENIIDYVKDVITNADIEYSRLTKKNNRDGTEKLYLYKGQYYLLAGIGTNGFLISIYPVREKTAKKLIERYNK